MKSIARPSLLALLILSIVLALSMLLEGCGTSCETTRTYVYYEPVYTGLDEIRSQVAVQPAREMKSLGRIYYKDSYLFINEPGQGIHVINNAQPSSPQSVTFINIPGNYDLAIKGNYLYADSYIDLVVFDVTNKSDIKKVRTLEQVFANYSSLGFFADGLNNVITTWEERETLELTTSECDELVEPWGGVAFREGVLFDFASAQTFDAAAAVAPNNGSGIGVAGSTARFGIAKDHLYMLDAGHLSVMDLEDPSQPEPGNKVYISWDIETIFPYNEYLFLGARSGMHIVSIATPDVPSLISTYSHINSCDPVVVDGNYAYVTLRSGNPTCEGFANQLEVIDISTPSKPALISTFAMHNPHGLGKDDDLLFICDGDAGLKVFDASNVLKIGDRLLAKHGNVHAYDVIPLDGLLMMIGEDGLRQYEYSEDNTLKLLSTLSIAE
jgi:hypothetical protein